MKKTKAEDADHAKAPNLGIDKTKASPKVKRRLLDKTAARNELYPPAEEATAKKQIVPKAIRVEPVSTASSSSQGPQHVYLGEEFDLTNRTKAYWSKFDKQYIKYNSRKFWR